MSTQSAQQLIHWLSRPYDPAKITLGLPVRIEVGICALAPAPLTQATEIASFHS